MVKLSRKEEAGLGTQNRSGRSSQAGEQELGVQEWGRTGLAGGAWPRVHAHVGGGTGSRALGLENSVGALPQYFFLSTLTVWSYLDLSQRRYGL